MELRAVFVLFEIRRIVLDRNRQALERADRHRGVSSSTGAENISSREFGQLEQSGAPQRRVEIMRPDPPELSKKTTTGLGAMLLEVRPRRRPPGVNARYRRVLTAVTLGVVHVLRLRGGSQRVRRDWLVSRAQLPAAALSGGAAASGDGVATGIAACRFDWPAASSAGVGVVAAKWLGVGAAMATLAVEAPRHRAHGSRGAPSHDNRLTALVPASARVTPPALDRASANERSSRLRQASDVGPLPQHRRALLAAPALPAAAESLSKHCARKPRASQLPSNLLPSRPARALRRRPRRRPAWGTKSPPSMYAAKHWPTGRPREQSLSLLEPIRARVSARHRFFWKARSCASKRSRKPLIRP